MITESQVKRVADDFTAIAGEAVEVDLINDTFYALCSELAALRLFREYNKNARNKKTGMGFSSNMGRWFFSLRVCL